MLEKSRLIRNKIYFYQSEFGVQWLMPIAEKNLSDGSYIDVIVSVDKRELEKLHKYDNIRKYMVEMKVKTGIFKNESDVWELPRDKWGHLPFYKHYCLKIDYLLSSILIPLDLIISDYPELISTGGHFCLGVNGDKEKLFKRECLLKNILNE